MKYRPLFFPFVWAIIILLVHSCNSRPSVNTAARPNILFIMTDDHGFQALSGYDSALVRTPNLDRIAEEGIRFTRAFVTNSLCAPSRAALLTGKFSHRNGLYINNRGFNLFDSTQVTFPKLLQQAGYQTAIVGKWHLRTTPMGFDYRNILPGQGLYYNPDFIEMGEKKRVEGYVTNLISDFALRWLRNRDPEKPFCLLVHEKAPHRPWMPDTADLHLFENENFPVPENFFDDYAGRRGAKEQKMSVIKDMDPPYDLKMVDPEGEIPGKYRKAIEGRLARMTPEQRKAWDREYVPKAEAFKKAGLSGEDLALWKLRRYLTDYLRCVVSVDRNVGRILDYLDSTGLSQNTLVVYTSDQGFYLGEHGWFDKRFMYEESFRTPLLMRLPGVAGGRVVDALVQNIDLAPTFLDLAGAEIPADMQGESLLPLLEQGKTKADWRNALYYHYYEFPSEHDTRRHYGIRTERFKLIHFYYDFDEWELFDLQADPHEMNNLYGQPGTEEMTNILKQKLDSLRTFYGDTLPDPEYIN